MRLLSELTPQVREARAAERQRDRQQAPRFNVFKYLRKDEHGLSRMIADLLDPTTEHGQGTKFLEAMLDALPETRGRFGALPPTVASRISVEREHRTKNGRSIDIAVVIPSATVRFCLAFENKPYAHDLYRQCSAYLEYLEAEYGTHFLLVYLPPADREPDEASLSRSDLERWPENFRVMPYAGGDVSLKNWFAACHGRCDAERVRWFLWDAESFCLNQFGESNMKIDPEARSVYKYLTDNPSHLRAAFSVSRAWPHLSADVCERFLKHLRHNVECQLRVELTAMTDDLQVRCHYGGERRESNYLWITRDGWMRYDGLPPNEPDRYAIMLQNTNYWEGPNGWYWGVRSPKSPSNEQETECSEKLDATLRQRGLSLRAQSDQWPQYEYLCRYEDWRLVVPDLDEECKAGGGPITDYYVKGLIDIASCAILAINEVEEENHGSRDVADSRAPTNRC